MEAGLEVNTLTSEIMIGSQNPNHLKLWSVQRLLW